ncbi:hypothetical protein SASPL_152491 [Salvia splendens]|uniref:Uncharacterized protein n=1 Tax=Salvia splendens TaxID=180675 RepID=A0A8X8W3P4_SALSN|nr:hypothetical protein SASPL_152491 [Salvia splendens]
MGLAVVVLPLTKLGGAALLLMVSLLWPFTVKFGFSYGPLREICWDMADALRLLMFREVDEEISYECDGSVLWDELEVSDCVSDLTESPSTLDSPAGRIGCLIGDGLNFNFSAAAREEGWITVRDNGMGIEGVIELNYELINGGLIEVEESLFHSNWDEISSSNINVSSLEYILGDSDVHDYVPISVALERKVMKDFCDSNQLFNVLSFSSYYSAIFS